jgi:hypothetical protein
MKKMKYFTIILCFIFGSTIVLAQKNKIVPYTVAENYFVKNSFKTSKELTLKIENKQKFEQVFGMAPLMGNDGNPTIIDFSKQFVLCVIGIESNLGTEYKMKNLSKNETGKIVLEYQHSDKPEQSYTSQACLIIIVDKKYTGKIIFKSYP